MSDNPISLGKERALREDNASVWSPRDALVHAIERIDRGEWEPTLIVIAGGSVDPARGDMEGFQTIHAAKDIYQIAGLLSLAEHLLWSGVE